MNNNFSKTFNLNQNPMASGYGQMTCYTGYHQQNANSGYGWYHQPSTSHDVTQYTSLNESPAHWPNSGYDNYGKQTVDYTLQRYSGYNWNYKQYRADQYSQMMSNNNTTAGMTSQYAVDFRSGYEQFSIQPQAPTLQSQQLNHPHANVAHDVIQPGGGGDVMRDLNSSSLNDSLQKLNTHRLKPPSSSTSRKLTDTGKPPYSYIALICMAIANSPEQMCTLRQIIDYIEVRFPYYRDVTHWHGSIRHNLTVNECFVKAGKRPGEKGSLWAVDDGFKDMFDNGSLLRRKYRSKKAASDAAKSSSCRAATSKRQMKREADADDVSQAAASEASTSMHAAALGRDSHSIGSLPDQAVYDVTQSNGQQQHQRRDNDPRTVNDLHLLELPLPAPADDMFQPIDTHSRDVSMVSYHSYMT